MRKVNVKVKNHFEKSMLEGLKYCKDNNINVFSGMMGESEQAEVLWNKAQSENIIDFLSIAKNLDIKLIHFFHKVYDGVDLEDYVEHIDYEEIEELVNHLEEHEGSSYFYIFEFMYNGLRYEYANFSSWAFLVDALEDIIDDEFKDEEDFIN